MTLSKPDTNPVLAIAVALVAALALGACNTIEGAGQDIENTGEEIEESAQ